MPDAQTRIAGGQSLPSHGVDQTTSYHRNERSYRLALDRKYPHSTPALAPNRVLHQRIGQRGRWRFGCLRHATERVWLLLLGPSLSALWIGNRRKENREQALERDCSREGGIETGRISSDGWYPETQSS